MCLKLQHLGVLSWSICCFTAILNRESTYSYWGSLTALDVHYVTLWTQWLCKVHYTCMSWLYNSPLSSVYKSKVWHEQDKNEGVPISGHGHHNTLICTCTYMRKVWKHINASRNGWKCIHIYCATNFPTVRMYVLAYRHSKQHTRLFERPQSAQWISLWEAIFRALRRWEKTT